MDLAAARPEPIPVFAEMSSTNPVFGASGCVARARRKPRLRIVRFIHSGRRKLRMKPGMVFLPGHSAAQRLGKKLQELVSGSAEFRLLTPGIRSSYLSAVAGRKKQATVKPVAEAANVVLGQDFPSARSFLKRM